MESAIQHNKSTSLDNLPEQPSQQDDGQQKLVQEILQEIKDDQQPSQQDIQQYQMDPNMNMGVGGQVPNQDEIRDMQQMQNLHQMQEQQLQDDHQHFQPTKSILEKLMDNSKETILVAVLFLLISQPFLNSTLSKIPKFLTETGDVSLVGLVVKATLASLIFLAVKTFVL